MGEIARQDSTELVPEDVKSVRQAIYRRRRKTQPKLSQSRDETHEVLQQYDMFSREVTHEAIQQYDMFSREVTHEAIQQYDMFSREDEKMIHIKNSETDNYEQCFTAVIQIYFTLRKN